MSRFTIITDHGPDGDLKDRYAIFDTLGDWPACKTIGGGTDDPSLTCLTLDDATRRASDLNAMSLDRQKLEEAHTLLTKLMEDIGDQVPYRAVVDWWLARNEPDVSEDDRRIQALEDAVGVWRATR